MDEQVIKAMQRWPEVPAVHGWLRLDRRGRWLLIDRAKPGFDESRDGQGSPITNEQILEFIARNYQADELGRWFWQNGPQRVFVDLDLAPLILRVLGSGGEAQLCTHTGVLIETVSCAWCTEHDDLMLDTELGPAALHDLDLGLLEFKDAKTDGLKEPNADPGNAGATGEAAIPACLNILGRTLTIHPANSSFAKAQHRRFDPKPRAS